MTQDIEIAKRELITMFTDHEKWARKWRDDGKKVLGYFCSYVPEEILYAARILPVRILGSPEPIDQVAKVPCPEPKVEGGFGESVGLEVGHAQLLRDPHAGLGHDLHQSDRASR